MEQKNKNLTFQNLIWTKHVKEKMRQYRLSESRLKRVLRNPQRKELGIAPRTIAIMQTAGTRKHPTEIWLMYQTTKLKVKSEKHAPYRNEVSGAGLKAIKIISAWRYPGISPKGQPPPIPEDILWEISLRGKE